MKNLSKIFLLSLLLTLSACNKNTLSSVVLQDSNGNNIEFTLHPKWIILNYWASWCKPCYEEIPALNNFYQQYQNQVMVLGVNYDDIKDKNELNKIIKKMQIHFPVLISDPAQIFGLDTVPGLPTTYVINPQGKVVKTLYGIQTVTTLKGAIGII